jgi:transposase InsO family protein
MPWREWSIMDQREELVRLALQPGANRSELFRRFGISRNNGYKWLKRFAVEGGVGLADRSRRPHRSPRRTADDVEAEVLRVREEHNQAWGGRKIAWQMRRNGWRTPAPSTITEILRRHDKLEANAAEHPASYQRFEREHPNELWQMDFKGHFALLRGRCHPLTVIDDHSRYALGLEACEDEQEATTRQRLTHVFRHYGLPFVMLMDNGPPWGDRGNADAAFTMFEVWLIRLGIRVTHGRPHHPQTQGKDERFHRTLKAEVLNNRSFRDLPECQRAFDRWRNIYNHERPHQALNFGTPGERYRVSTRAFPERLPEIEYGPDDLVRKVDLDGFISFKNRSIRIGKGLRRQPIALRATHEDGVFSAHFCTQQIGTIDLRKPAPSACGFVDIATTADALGGAMAGDAHKPTGPAATAEQN